jgi:hypothetical protein
MSKPDRVTISREHFNRLCQLAAKHKYGKCDCFDANSTVRDALQKLLSLYDKCTQTENFTEEWIHAIDEGNFALLSAVPWSKEALGRLANDMIAQESETEILAGQVRNLGMFVRRLIRHNPNPTLVRQANVYLKKIGQEETVLRQCYAIGRCQVSNAEVGQCELEVGHTGKHLAGYLMWA